MAFLWLFLAATVVATMTFISILVWSENRLKDRREFYRFEFRKRLVEAGKLDADSVAALMRYEHELGLRQTRQKLLVAGLIILGVGVGTCFGLGFISKEIWMLGYIPVAVGVSMLIGYFLVAKPAPEQPPMGWAPEGEDRA